MKHKPISGVVSLPESMSRKRKQCLVRNARPISSLFFFSFFGSSGFREEQRPPWLWFDEESLQVNGSKVFSFVILISPFWGNQYWASTTTTTHESCTHKKDDHVQFFLLLFLFPPGPYLWWFGPYVLVRFWWRMSNETQHTLNILLGCCTSWFEWWI